MATLEEIRSFVGDDENKGTSSIAEFPLLTKNAVESLRYRAEVIYYFLYPCLAERKRRMCAYTSILLFYFVELNFYSLYYF